VSELRQSSVEQIKNHNMKGVKHYTEDGEYNGPTHKMPGGKVHTGKKHSDDSKPVSHKPGGPFKMRTPFRCWKTHKRKPGTKEFSQGSCIPK